MRIVKLSVPAILIASLFSSLSYAAVQDRIASSLTNGQTVTLRGGVHRRALPQFDQGPVDDHMGVAGHLRGQHPFPSRRA